MISILEINRVVYDRLDIEITARIFIVGTVDVNYDLKLKFIFQKCFTTVINMIFVNTFMR